MNPLDDAPENRDVRQNPMRARRPIAAHTWTQDELGGILGNRVRVIPRPPHAE